MKMINYVMFRLSGGRGFGRCFLLDVSPLPAHVQPAQPQSAHVDVILIPPALPESTYKTVIIHSTFHKI